MPVCRNSPMTFEVWTLVHLLDRAGAFFPVRHDAHGNTVEMTLGLNDVLRGKFIVLDGPDGSGKGTQIELLRQKLVAEGLKVVYCRDPGGTAIGDRIREMLLKHDLSAMDVRCEAFLFMASRAQLVGEMIEPAIKAGKMVLGDRFISATCAYQGAAGFNVERIIELGRFAVGDTWPDLTLILDVPVEEGFRRMGLAACHDGPSAECRPGNGRADLPAAQPDAMEARPLEFHRKVRQLFLALPPTYPGRVEVIDGLAPPEEVHERILKSLTNV